MTTRIDPDRAFAAALQGRGFSVNQPSASAPAARPAPPATTLRAGDIHLGDAEVGGAVGLSLDKLLDGRLLIQGMPGAGKSWTLRRLLEQTTGLIQHIVIDPEGEFAELGEKLELLRLEGHRLDFATLALAAARAREHRASVLLDLSELGPDEQMAAATAFVTALIAVQREHWAPALVAIDEAHLFAPYGGFSEATAVRKASIAAITDLMNRGRKRGLAGVLATQRLVRLAKSAAAPVLNFMIGANTLDLDIRRAAETIGWDARKAFDRLPLLAPGDFVATGPAFSLSPSIMRVGSVETPHRGATPHLDPIDLDRTTAAKLLDLDTLLASSAADQALRDEHAAAPGLRTVRGFVREPAFADAGRVWGELQKLAPNGARLAQLAKHLKLSADKVAAALDLLDRYGCVEFMGDGAERAARISEDMA